LLGGLGAGLAIIMMLVAWQLSSGPISLAFLSPYIENAINTGHKSFKLTLKDTILTWAGWQRTLDIRVLDVKVLRPDGSLIGSVPEVSFSLSGRALIGGLFAPRSVELFGPRLLVRREQDGRIDIGFRESEGPSSEFAQRLIAQLLAEPDSKNAMSYLSRLEIVSAEITLEDRLLGKSWVVPASDVSLRRDQTGLKGTISLALDVDGQKSAVAVKGDYVTALRRFDLVVDFADISPAAFSSIYYELGPLRAFDLPLKGTFTASIAADGTMEAAGFNLQGGRGQFNLPYPFEQALAVENVVLKGHYQGPQNLLDVDELSLKLGPDGLLRLPEPANHAMPLSSITLKGRYDGNSRHLEISNLKADLNGPIAELSLMVDGFPRLKGDRDGAIVADVKGSLSDVPASRLSEYWPAVWGADARRWVVGHLSDGVVHQARSEMRFSSGKDEKFRLVSIDGDMDVSGVTVNFLPPMPPVRDASAYMKFNAKRFDVFISQGTARGLSVREGKIFFTGLDEIDQFADITLDIAGSFGDQLAYAEQEPLRYATAIGIDPKTTKGSAETQLKLKFILEKSLTMERVQVSAKAKVKDVAAAKAVLGRDISNGQLDVRVDNKGMDITGRVTIGRIPATLVWRENFGDRQKIVRVYDVKAKLVDTGHLGDINQNLAPFADKFIRGKLDAEVKYTVFNDSRRRLEIKTDITNAELLAPAFGWGKKAGVAGEAEIVMAFKGEEIADVPRFSVVAQDLEVRGHAEYGPKPGALRRIEFDRVSYGRTDIKGALISRGDGGWDAGFHGASFDMSSLWEDIVRGGADDPAGDTFKLPYLTLAVELDRVWIGPDRLVKRASGTFEHKDDYWRTILLKGEIGDKKSFELSIRPDTDGNRKLVMTSAEAGETLKMMNYYENMSGGKLRIDGKYNDSLPGRPLRARLRVSDYRIVNAPVLTHVLSIMALTGIIEALQGKGLAFNSLDIPFVLGDGWLEIKNATASGPSLGFTASGTIYTRTDFVDINGTVVPAYAINSALGRLPVIGEIFSGGERGGGIFAANFTMTGSTAEPKVSVNPLTALTPGIFRNVFDIFGQAETRSDRLRNGGLE
jgi:hypothetical protein